MKRRLIAMQRCRNCFTPASMNWRNDYDERKEIESRSRATLLPSCLGSPPLLLANRLGANHFDGDDRELYDLLSGKASKTWFVTLYKACT